MDFWDKTQKAFKTAYNWLLRYPVALVVSILVVVGAALLLLFGVGDRFNVGGFIGKLFGKKGNEEDNVTVANEVPSDRKDEEGNPIPTGEPDEEGWVQQEVEVLDQPKNPFRDKSKIKVKDKEGKSKSIQLPTGVKDTDVKKVIEVGPKDYKVVVEEGPSKVDQDTIDLLRG